MMKREKEIFFRVRDLEAMGLTRGKFQGLIRRGEVQQVARGIYRWTDSEPNEYYTLAATIKAIPDGVICLLSALRFHEIGTQEPHQVWIAIDRKSRLPKATGLPIRVVRFSKKCMTYGIETREVEGLPMKMTSPARTVVDCFRYRNKIGMDVALEALKEALKQKKASRDEILRAADVCRVISIIKPYIQAISL
jgi:predicted transcriptional regulator of viral defense system